MYDDLILLLMIYLFSVASLGISVYTLWTLKETTNWLKDQNSRKQKSAWDYYHDKVKNEPIKVPRAKGHWD